GFLRELDYTSVIKSGRLANGTPWTVPITLSVHETTLTGGDKAALKDEAGNLLGAIHVSEVFRRDLAAESEGVFRTTDDGHPGVARIKNAGQILVAGEVDLLPEALATAEQGMIYRPADVRAEIDKRG